jgi:hypothetical protein
LSFLSFIIKNSPAGRWWLLPVILATQEAEIRRIEVLDQPGQIIHKPQSRKTHHKNGAGGVAQGAGSEFKPQYHKTIVLVSPNHLNSGGFKILLPYVPGSKLVFLSFPSKNSVLFYSCLVEEGLVTDLFLRKTTG